MASCEYGICYRAGNSRCVFVATKTNLLYSRWSQRRKTMKRTYIKFRCTIYEKKLLVKRAERAGISLSEYCRNTAFGRNVIERLSAEQLECYKTLVNYKNNFTRIGNMFRKRNPKLADEVKQLAREIGIHLKNFRK